MDCYRDSRLDQRDVQLVNAMRSKQKELVFSIKHKSGFEDPRLWVPDQILGAYGDQLCLTELDDDWLNAWRLLEPQSAIYYLARRIGNNR